jgi:hypothetical protein
MRRPTLQESRGVSKAGRVLVVLALTVFYGPAALLLAFGVLVFVPSILQLLQDASSGSEGVAIGRQFARIVLIPLGVAGTMGLYSLARLLLAGIPVHRRLTLLVNLVCGTAAYTGILGLSLITGDPIPIGLIAYVSCAFATLGAFLYRARNDLLTPRSTEDP